MKAARPVLKERCSVAIWTSTLTRYRGALYGESIALAFSLYLLEKYSVRSRWLPRSHGKLSGLQLRQLIEFTHEYLSEDLSLIDLTNYLNLSPYHFARLVKSTLGQSPHQYVLQLRIERAKQLMTFRERFSLSEIASQVGFYDHAHFTKAFKRVVGVSPKQFSQKMQAGQAALAKYKQSKTVDYVPAASKTNPQAAMYVKDTSGSGDYYTSTQRGVIPAWKNQFATMSWVNWLNLDSINSVAPKITQPFLMVHSDKSALPDNARRF